LKLEEVTRKISGGPSLRRASTDDKTDDAKTQSEIFGVDVLGVDWVALARDEQAETQDGAKKRET
jgi:hypothetical protein